MKKALIFSIFMGFIPVSQAVVVHTTPPDLPQEEVSIAKPGPQQAQPKQGAKVVQKAMPAPQTQKQVVVRKGPPHLRKEVIVRNETVRRPVIVQEQVVRKEVVRKPVVVQERIVHKAGKPVVVQKQVMRKEVVRKPVVVQEQVAVAPRVIKKKRYVKRYMNPPRKVVHERVIVKRPPPPVVEERVVVRRPPTVREYRYDEPRRVVVRRYYEPVYMPPPVSFSLGFVF